MSVSGSTHMCPRCHTRLPAPASFCSACGLSFSVSNDDATRSSGPGNPARWPSQSRSGSPAVGQAGPGSSPGPVAVPSRKARKGGAGKIIVLALVLIVLVGGGGAAWFLYFSPGHLSSPLFDRHGLQSNVPLPDGASFANVKQTYSAPDPQAHTTIRADTWGWTVSGSDAAAVQRFYQENLPSQDWTRVKLAGANDEKIWQVTACQGNQVLLVVIKGEELAVSDRVGRVVGTITPPRNGSALFIELVSSPQAAQNVCTDIPVL